MREGDSDYTVDPPPQYYPSATASASTSSHLPPHKPSNRANIPSEAGPSKSRAKTVSQPWTSDEDALLLRLGTERKNNNSGWHDVCVQFKGRTPTAVKNRWTLVRLRIGLPAQRPVHEPPRKWSREEDDLIISLCTERMRKKETESSETGVNVRAKNKQSWDAIVSRFQGRTLEAIKTRWGNLRRELGEHTHDLAPSPPDEVLYESAPTREKSEEAVRAPSEERKIDIGALPLPAEGPQTPIPSMPAPTHSTIPSPRNPQTLVASPGPSSARPLRPSLEDIVTAAKPPLWTSEEDARLLGLVTDQVLSWDGIASRFPDRLAETVITRGTKVKADMRAAFKLLSAAGIAPIPSESPSPSSSNVPLPIIDGTVLDGPPATGSGSALKRGEIFDETVSAKRTRFMVTPDGNVLSFAKGNPNPRPGPCDSLASPPSPNGEHVPTPQASSPSRSPPLEVRRLALKMLSRESAARLPVSSERDNKGGP